MMFYIIQKSFYDDQAREYIRVLSGNSGAMQIAQMPGARNIGHYEQNEPFSNVHVHRN